MSNIVSLSWSPSGLAKNRRSVLAVLTSNLILSFWASTSDPSVVASWKRVLVVNNCIRESRELKSSLNDALTSTNTVLRQLLRIRSAAWAPLIQRKSRYDETTLTRLSDLYFVAVTTDDNSMLFLSVSSPYTDDSMCWDARVVRQYNFSDESSLARTLLPRGVIEEEPESEVHRRQALSDWKQKYLYHRGSLLLAALQTKCFIDGVSWGAWFHAGAHAEIMINFQKDNANIGHAKFYISLDFPLRTSFSKPSIYSTAGPFTCKHENLNIESVDLPRSALHRKAHRLRAKYDRQNDYGGLTTIKFWGLATYENYAAICVTLHPGDMVDYLLASEERATILFGVLGTERLDAELETFKWERDSNTGDTTNTQRAILQTVFDLERQSKRESGGLSNRIVYAAACSSMLLWDNERTQRLSLALDVLDRLERKGDIDLGSEISACSQLLRTPNIEMEEAIAILEEATGARSREDLNNAVKVSSVCSICACAIHWRSLLEAACSQGHCFGVSFPPKLVVYTSN